MAYCKKFIVLFLILFIILFNFSSVFAVDEESVNYNTINGLAISPSYNYFTTSDLNVSYFELENGYIYHISVPDSYTISRYIATSNSVPAVNVTYNYLGVIEPGETFNYIANGSTYIYFTSTPGGIVVTREKIASQDTAIVDLVDNVGPNALWGVFGSGIDFVFVIVIVAFGIFIIFKLISVLSKGKSRI